VQCACALHTASTGSGKAHSTPLEVNNAIRRVSTTTQMERRTAEDRRASRRGRCKNSQDLHEDREYLTPYFNSYSLIHRTTNFVSAVTTNRNNIAVVSLFIDTIDILSITPKSLNITQYTNTKMQKTI